MSINIVGMVCAGLHPLQIDISHGVESLTRTSAAASQRLIGGGRYGTIMFPKRE